MTQRSRQHATSHQHATSRQHVTLPDRRDFPANRGRLNRRSMNPMLDDDRTNASPTAVTRSHGSGRAVESRPEQSTVDARWPSLAITVRLVGIGCLMLGLASAELMAQDAADPQRLRLTGRYAEAITAWQERGGDEAVVGLAQCWRESGKTTEAQAVLAEAATKSPKNADIPAALAQLAFERGDYPAARKLVDAALQLDRRNPLAHWFDAELFRVAGDLKKAEAGYEWFIDFYNGGSEFTSDDLRLIGLAAAQYARWNRNSRQFSFLVNTLYPDALKDNEKYWPARLESARLFMEKYNTREAKTDLDAALAINPGAAELLATRARMQLDEFDVDGATRSVEQALKVNPRLLAAIHARADVFLIDLRPAEAVDVLEEALKINPVDEETLGRLAAAYGAVDGAEDGGATKRGESRAAKIIRQAIARNEHCGTFFSTLGDSYDRMRKFPQAAHFYEQAIERMPQLIDTAGKLGLMQMRLGNETQAARLFKESFEADPFNVRVKNMMSVLDVLAGYATLETDHFIIRFDRGHDEVLARYVARYLEDEVYPELVDSLGFEPPEKSLFEIFNRAKNTSAHGWFSARMIGLPFIHTVGACAGKMVALTSPNAGRKKFNWARVLKHEFVHVVNLQQTRFNIPHWFTEALAVWHERLPRPQQWTDLLARRQRAGTLFNLKDINYGFIRPQNSDNWTLAYCQAEIYVEYMIARFGEPVLAKMLQAYADNLTTDAAIQRVMNLETDEFERGYAEFVAKIVANVQTVDDDQESFAELQRAAVKQPDDADLAARLAYGWLQRRENEKARTFAEQAAKADEKHPLAGYVRARLLLADGEVRRARELLTEVLDEESPQPNVLGLLAGLRLKSKAFADAERLYRLGAKAQPGEMKWLKSLAQVYLVSEQEDKLAETLAKLATVDYDNVTLRRKLMELARKRRDFPAVQQWATETLHIDIMNGAAHYALAESLVAAKKFPAAIGEFEVALQIDADQAQWRFALADALVQNEQKAKAIETLEELLRREPNFPGAGLLLESLKNE